MLPHDPGAAPSHPRVPLAAARPQRPRRRGLRPGPPHPGAEPRAAAHRSARRRHCRSHDARRFSAQRSHWHILATPVSGLIASFLVLLLRCWSVGTYVNDAGIAVQRLLGTDSVRWAQVREVMDESGLVIVTLRDGRRLGTHISRRSLDLIGRPEAYDMAKLAVQRWGEQRWGEQR